jgi:hypothetical protein
LDDPTMTTIAADLAKLLAKVNRPGDVVTSGTSELLAPVLQRAARVAAEAGPTGSCATRRLIEA